MKKAVKRITLQEALHREKKDPAFRFYFEREQAIVQIAVLVRKLREQAGLTQAELAAKAQTTQAAIARLESGNDLRTPSLDLLSRIAHAAKTRLLIRFETKRAA